jgi:hypothetical protein
VPQDHKAFKEYKVTLVALVLAAPLDLVAQLVLQVLGAWLVIPETKVPLVLQVSLALQVLPDHLDHRVILGPVVLQDHRVLLVLAPQDHKV